MHSGSITWDSPVIEYQYSVDNTNWHSQEAATDKYRREKQVGDTWKAGYQYKGIDGSPGSNGSDANVNFNNILSALKKAAGVQSTFITADEFGSPNIYGGKIYGAEIFAGNGSPSFAEMQTDGFFVYTAGVRQPKASLTSGLDGNRIQLVLGAGSSNNSAYDILTLSKVQNGAKLLYTSASGQLCGFTFQNGVISVDGELGATAHFA